MSFLAKTGGLGPKLPSIFLIAVFILGSVLLAGAVLAHRYWPFRESAVRSDLAAALSADVRFGRFRTKYFPPGCVAESVRFERSGAGTPWMTVRRLTITSSLGRLLEHHVGLIRAEGVHLGLTRQDFAGRFAAGRQRPIDRLIAHDATIEIGAAPAQPSQRFVFYNLRLEDVNEAGPTRFWATVENPVPKGLLRASGQIGPWKGSHPHDAELSGQYSLENADLAVFNFLGGAISSTGHFQGRIRTIEVAGSIHTPMLEVRSTKHGLPLEAQFSASVNTATGDVLLERVTAQFGHDELEAHGTIARGADRKRAANIDLHCRRGRIEDTFYPFIKSPRSPLTGNTAFTMRIRISGGRERFFKRLDLTSDFRIEDARFTHAATQAEITKLSETQGHGSNDQITSSFEGQVSMHQGIAHFADLSIQGPGASASFRGTYSLLSERVDLHGQLNTASSLAKTTHGIRAAFAKVLDPFFKKRPHLHQVPVKIGGTYSQPSFGLDLGAGGGM
jgi:hypothetical protein